MEEIRKKEIHHRIKNNLQVISTLLYLESGNFTDENVITAFKESQYRVKSMALVHEKLYQSEDMVSVDFADYIQNLADYLLQSYSMGHGEVSLKLDVEKIFLGMDTAVPLGIIINELISNSLKHAFNKEEEGKIYIKLQSSEEYPARQGERSRNFDDKMIGNESAKTIGFREIAGNKKEKLILTVRDNGIGFPDKLDFRNTTSLGLQLVITLVDQIEGDIELDTKAGTEFKISFFRS